MQRLSALFALIAFSTAGAVHAQDDGFKPLFNGKDLTGWHNVNCAPGTWFVKDNMIITTGKPTGYLRTNRQYENFILEFEWFHAPSPKGSVGNSGLFVWGDPIPAVGTGYTRSIEVQVLVNLLYKDKKTGLPTATSHGDLFSIWGATCKPDRPHPTGQQRCLPSENLAKGEYEWNHYRVTGNNGVLKLAVNGKEVSGVTECNPRKGYLALESEGSECRFKNLKIKELPSTNPKPAEICDLDVGFLSLFTGLDLAGWKASDDHKAHWVMKDGVLYYDGQCKASDPHLWTEKSYSDFELTFDWKAPRKGKSGIALRGSEKFNVPLPTEKDGGSWSRWTVSVKGDRLTVTQNRKVVVDGMPLTGIPTSGPLGLLHHGDPVHFRNVFVRDLK